VKLRNLLALILCFFSTQAFAVDVLTQTVETRNYLSAGMEYAQFSLGNGGKINGTSLHLDFTHYFNNRFGMEVSLSSAVNASAATASSFTTIGAYGYYTAFGDCCSLNKIVSLDGVPILIESTNKKNSLKVGAGIDQVFLNGSKSVYSISGLGLGAQYDFKMFNRLFKASGRYSMMSSNNIDITGLFFGLQMTFGL